MSFMGQFFSYLKPHFFERPRSDAVAANLLA